MQYNNLLSSRYIIYLGIFKYNFFFWSLLRHGFYFNCIILGGHLLFFCTIQTNQLDIDPGEKNSKAVITSLYIPLYIARPLLYILSVPSHSSALLAIEHDIIPRLLLSPLFYAGIDSFCNVSVRNIPI